MLIRLVYISEHLFIWSVWNLSYNTTMDSNHKTWEYAAISTGTYLFLHQIISCILGISLLKGLKVLSTHQGLKYDKNKRNSWMNHWGNIKREKNNWRLTWNSVMLRDRRERTAGNEGMTKTPCSDLIKDLPFFFF